MVALLVVMGSVVGEWVEGKNDVWQVEKQKVNVQRLEPHSDAVLTISL